MSTCNFIGCVIGFFIGWYGYGRYVAWLDKKK